MKNLLEVQAPTPETIEEYRRAIIDILSSGAEEKTLRVALGVLRDGISLPTLSNCVFNGDATPESLTKNTRSDSENQPEPD